MRILFLAATAACTGVSWDFPVDVGTETALSGVSGSGPDDVYLVGGREPEAGAPRTGSIWHFDGTEWGEDASAPETELLVWAHAFSASDVWVVGEGGAILRGSVGDWEPIASGTTEPLWGVWGASADDVWIVGGDVNGSQPILLRYQNGGITEVPLDQTGFERPAVALLKVWGIDGRTFAVGTGGLIVEWTGDTWVEMPTGALANDDFVSLWGTSANNIVAVGGRATARIATFDGTSWTTIAPSGLAGLNAVTFDSEGTAIIGGENGWVGTFDPTVGEPVAEDFLALTTGVHALWFDGDQTTYGAAARFATPYTGAAIVRQH